MEDWLAVNLASWEERAPAHARSADYALARFRDDPRFISDVVRFDLPRLGSVAGLRGLHLQCHIGTDTLSLARLGARMTGLDFSGAALAEARALSEQAGPAVRYVQSELYEACEALAGESFDLLYTGIGALCWLPRIDDWADVVAGLLAPGGRLFLREGHPMLWAIEDSRPDDLLVVANDYFERPEPYVEISDRSYVQTEAPFEHTVTHSWNHGIGEVVTALLERGLRMTQLSEHDSVPWEAFPGRMEKLPDGEYRLPERPWRLAASYTLQAVRER